MMTVKELINELNSLIELYPSTKNLDVYIEGCDCIGQSLGVEYKKTSKCSSDTPWILITRVM